MINPILRDENNIHFRFFFRFVGTNENTSFDEFDLIVTSNMDFCVVIFMMVLCQVTSVGGMLHDCGGRLDAHTIIL